MSIKKNRELMFEQIKRLRGELKESVNENKEAYLHIIKHGGKVRYLHSVHDNPKMGGQLFPEKGAKEYLMKQPNIKVMKWVQKGSSPNADYELKESVNEEETKGISKDLMKKIEVVIKRGLGLKKLREVIGPIDDGAISNISKAIFEIGQSTIGGGVFRIEVIKFLGRPIYKAQIDIISTSDYGLYGYGGYGRNKYSNEADLLKAIFNMVKKEKDRLTAVYNGKSYLKQSYLGFKESVNEKYDGPMTIKVPAGEKLKIGSIIRAEDERGKSILAKVVKHSGKGKRGTNHYTVEPIEEAVKTWKQL